MRNKKVLLSLFLMIVISWASFKGYDINFLQRIHPVAKHCINFGLLISVALIGAFSIKQFSEKWILSVWTLVYVAVISVLVLIGIVDVVHRITNYLIRDSIAPVRMFFTSPVPFLIILYLKHSMQRAATDK